MNEINKSKTTASDLLDSITQYVKELATSTDEVRKSEQFKAWMDAMSAFCEYSFRNQMLILRAKPDATKVAGFNAWKSLGRIVKKGEHGIKILAPSTKNVKRTDEKTGEEKEDKYTNFYPVTVFDLSQTEGKELPEIDTDLHGDDFGWLHERLNQVCAEKGINVEYRELGVNGLYGYASKQGIVIADGKEINTQVNTLIHELGHMILHVSSDEHQKRSENEIEAEGAAYVVMRHFGMEPKSFNYLALYHADEKKILERMKCISDASREIITLVSKEKT